jgi:hypothetical protein
VRLPTQCPKYFPRKAEQIGTILHGEMSVKIILNIHRQTADEIPRQLAVISLKKCKISHFLTVNAICRITCMPVLYQARNNKCCNNVTLTANAYLHPVLIKQLTTTAEITQFC